MADKTNIRNTKTAARMLRWIHLAVCLLSLSLIAFISYDTFSGVEFLKNSTYMTFQLWVCLIFLADFFVELSLSPDRRQYVRTHWFFLLISIPYLNIIRIFNIDFSPDTLYFIRYIPLIRGAYSLAMVVGYFFTDRAFSLLAQYAAILISVVYLSSLIFYYEEADINSNVLTYWDSLYWACMNTTTCGSYINALTVAGKILSVVLAVLGMMMLPLFTVYITARVKNFNSRHAAS